MYFIGNVGAGEQVRAPQKIARLRGFEVACVILVSHN